MYNGLLDASHPSAPEAGSSRGSAGAGRYRFWGRGAAGPSPPPRARQRREEPRPPAEGIAVPPRSPATRPGVPNPPSPAAARPLPPPQSRRRGLPDAAAAAPHGLGRVPPAGRCPEGAGRAPALPAGMLKDGARLVEVKNFFGSSFLALVEGGAATEM